MAYIDRHFAVAIYDLGEPQAQEMARLALAEDCTRFMLCHGDEEVLVTPSLTMDCRMAYEEAQGARPASFASFMRATASLTQSFTLPETYSGMGLEPNTTSCQLRWGIEHVFPSENDPLSLIATSVGFSFRTDFRDNAIAERFFEEDRLVGTWRPWFNIDSER
jgi:hypothetical protein